MTDLETTYAARLAVWQDEAIERTAERVRLEGARVMESGLRLSGTLPALVGDLLTVREQIATFGADQLRAELARQGG